MDLLSVAESNLSVVDCIKIACRTTKARDALIDSKHALSDEARVHMRLENGKAQGKNLMSYRKPTFLIPPSEFGEDHDN